MAFSVGGLLTGLGTGAQDIGRFMMQAKADDEDRRRYEADVARREKELNRSMKWEEGRMMEDRAYRDRTAAEAELRRANERETDWSREQELVETQHQNRMGEIGASSSASGRSPFGYTRSDARRAVIDHFTKTDEYGNPTGLSIPQAQLNMYSDHLYETGEILNVPGAAVVTPPPVVETPEVEAAPPEFMSEMPFSALGGRARQAISAGMSRIGDALVRGPQARPQLPRQGLTQAPSQAPMFTETQAEPPALPGAMEAGMDRWASPVPEVSRLPNSMEAGMGNWTPPSASAPAASPMGVPEQVAQPAPRLASPAPAAMSPLMESAPMSMMDPDARAPRMGRRDAMQMASSAARDMLPDRPAGPSRRDIMSAASDSAASMSYREVPTDSLSAMRERLSGMGIDPDDYFKRHRIRSR